VHLTVRGELRVPSDKSVTHRALILAAMARGESRVHSPLDAADTRSTAAALRLLGCEVSELSSTAVVVRSRGSRGWWDPSGAVQCDNSGTTARLLMGCLAGAGVRATLDGDGSLRRRPMARVIAPLREAGGRISCSEADGRLPVRLEGGALGAISHASPVASAQVKGALLLAGLAAGVPVRVSEPARSRDHTERMLRHLGVEVDERDAGGRWEVEMPTPPEELPPIEVTIPGDPSSAAYRVALALMADRGEITLRNVLAGPTRSGFLDLIARMGAALEVHPEGAAGPEPLATLVARPSRLSGIRVEPEEVPAAIDELVLLGALAARAEGETVVRGATELRVKESDRIAALVGNLRALGARAEELEDGFVVHGSEAPLVGRVVTHGDHRLAMAFGVLAALPGNRIEVDDPGCVAVSDPGFWDDLRTLTGRNG
jgi:3-phosphoshikimate 1-carboxyvinyltransferase